MENELQEQSYPRLVMLVDDSSIDNFVNQKMIERNKFSQSTMTFTKGDKALEYLAEVDKKKSDISAVPFIIFLDLNMPLLSGFQFIEVYEKLSDFIKSRCRIIVLTSSISPYDIVKCNENKNVLTFLNKPLMKNNFEEINLLIKKQPEYHATIFSDLGV
jgi:CheY-like chemotaxis protein